MRDPQSMKSRGFGFVSYPKKEVFIFIIRNNLIRINGDKPFVDCHLKICFFGTLFPDR